MNSKSSKDSVKIFSQYLASLNPFEFTLTANILGYIFSLGLDAGEQNAVGNWFELIGQIMLTISAQATADPTNEDLNNILNDIEVLKKEIDQLKKTINNE